MNSALALEYTQAPACDTIALAGRDLDPTTLEKLRQIADTTDASMPQLILAALAALLARLQWAPEERATVVCGGDDAAGPTLEFHDGTTGPSLLGQMRGLLEPALTEGQPCQWRLYCEGEFTRTTGVLSWTCDELGQHHSVEVKISQDRSGTIEGGDASLLWLLEQFARDWGSPLWRHSLLDPGQVSRLALAAKVTAAEYPRDSTLPALFDRIADDYPSAVACECGGAVLDYRSLQFRSRELSSALAGQGVRQGGIVGVYARNLDEFLVVALAILRRGAAYLPLDPHLPVDRMRHIVENSAAQMIVGSAPPGKPPGVPVLSLSQLLAESSPRLVPDEKRSANTAAYVMYTSGSTGLPKGIVICDRGIVRLVRNTNYMKFGPSRRIGRLAPLSFDASTFEIWGALLNGGTVIDFGSPIMTPSAFRSQLLRKRIDTLFMATALFHQMAKALPEAFASLETLLIGGEQLAPDIYATVLDHSPPARLVNIYGPTENTSFSTFKTLVKPPRPGDRFVPIGFPISNTRLYILDRHGHPVPDGVAGEIVVAGDGLAIGYHRNEELSQAKFRCVQGLGRRDERCYFTGDIGYRNPDGEIVCIGRKDAQVKIRGHRIELEDVEHWIRRHPGVAHAAAAVKESPDHARHLVAFVQPVSGQSLVAAELLAVLRTQVPEYMVPAVVRIVPRIPVNANGKVDRKALLTHHE